MDKLVDEAYASIAKLLKIKSQGKYQMYIARLKYT